MNQEMINKPRILLIDDEEGIRTVLKITLESSGYDVSLASDGDAGLALFNQTQPDIVITDIKMPGINGIELLKRIKSQAPETEVIMITGHGDMDLAVRSLQYEAADFITKPIDVDVLDTAIKKTEDRINISRHIRQYMDDLETLVREKDKQINESEKLITIGQSIAGMSHAIKNIAGGLKGGAFVLEQGIDQENREYLKKGWEMMKGNIDKITKLSLDLLNYAKSTSLSFSMEAPDSPAMEVMQLTAHRAEASGVNFQFHPCGGQKKIFMDRGAIHNCLLTIVTNAFDALESLEESGRTGQIRFEVREAEDWIEYRVKDNGSGIKKAIRKLIFNDFVTTKGVNGTGFGLMTTKKVVEEHKGAIRFDTQDNEGTEFVIRIPAAPGNNKGAE